MDLSIIIPAYNEEKRIASFLKELSDFFKNDPRAIEIIVVDDGSVDGTSRIVQDLPSAKNIRLIRFEKNGGKGRAVKEGMLAATGNFRVFMDADGSYSPKTLMDNSHYLSEGYDLVIGSRYFGTSGGFQTESVPKKIMRNFFTALVRVFLFKGIRDTQCGFKMFSKKAAEDLFNKTTLKGFGMDLEIIYLALKKGFHIKEAPVTCVHKEGSKIRFLSDSLKLFVNIFEIRLRHG